MSDTLTPLQPLRVRVKTGLANVLHGLPIVRNAGSSASITVLSHPVHGCVYANGQGQLIYAAKQGYLGPDRFIYRDGRADVGSSEPAECLVELQVTRRPLVAAVARWGRFALNADSVLMLPTAALLKSAPESPIDGMSVLSMGQAQHGQLTRQADGDYIYWPAPGYVGPDSFDYVMADKGGKKVSAMVRIDVSASTAPPTLEFRGVPPEAICERLLSATPRALPQPSLHGQAALGSEVHIIVDGMAVASRRPNLLGRWEYSTERLSQSSRLRVQVVERSPEGTVQASEAITISHGVNDDFDGSGALYRASSSARSLRAGYNGRRDSERSGGVGTPSLTWLGHSAGTAGWHPG